MGTRIRLAGVLAIVLSAAVIPASAAAANKQLWASNTLSAIADDVVGTTDMSVLSEDDAGASEPLRVGHGESFPYISRKHS